MPHKCSVVKCRAGYTNGPVRPMFSFPSNTDLRQRWIQFINREDFSVTSSSRIVSITSNLSTFCFIYTKLDSICQ